MFSFSVPFIIRRSQIREIVGLSPSTIERLEAENQFPKRRRFSAGIVGYLGQEVVDWVNENAGDYKPQPRHEQRGC